MESTDHNQTGFGIENLSEDEILLNLMQYGYHLINIYC